MKPRVSIVVPLYNEQGNLSPLTKEIRAAMGATAWSWELILVDDGSEDESLAECLAIARGEPRVRVVGHRRRAGQSAALAAGFARARGEWIVTLDADLQNDPADIPRLLAETPAHDVVSGIRTNRQDRWLRRVSGRAANALRRRVLGDSVTDIGCSLRVYRASLLRETPVFDGMHRFLPALLEHRGVRIAELPVRHRPRLCGATKYGLGNRLRRGLVDLLAVRWLLDRRVDPDNAVERGQGSVATWRAAAAGRPSTTSADRATAADTKNSAGSPSRAPSQPAPSAPRNMPRP